MTIEASSIAQKCRVNACHGFTLMEIMTVVAVIGILAAISVPNFFAWRQSARFRSAAQDLISDLSMARLHAIKNGDSVKVKFANDRYTIFIDQNGDDVVDPGEERLRNKNYPAGIVMHSTTFTGAKTVFHQSGSVTPAGSVTLAHGSEEHLRIIVNMVGRIRTTSS